ncbi:HAD-IC family P-type ATPase [Methanoculleus chikugoensis]|uniref:HAD-IC family P-type ATPase n=1 Tax=Methanoculleus chikugoensis TaxID=118126 RepID=UPI000A4C56D4|nr:HAD-IC family P-type ATPase [Methanoculleus chikugoensis]
MLLSFVFVVIGITVYQEQKTERALEALRDLSSPRALVIREGEQKRIPPGREVVSRDILVVSEGDRVPADAVLISANNLLVDESLLTGESVPARKVPWHDGVTIGRPGGEDQPMVYSGTLVVQGQGGLAEVRSTGPRTEMGKIGTVLTSVERSKTRLKGEIDRLVRDIALLGLGLVAVIVVVYGLTRFNWTGGFLAGITLAMAILPEELPVVLTIFLALGAWRIAGRNVLTRQAPPAIETLGSATVLCVDKTGTLTQNRMTVRRLFAHGRECEYDRAGKSVMPEFCHELVEFGILACKRDPPFDPMEKALRQLTEDLARTEHIHEDWDLLQEYPLSQELLAMSNVWRSREGGAGTSSPQKGGRRKRSPTSATSMTGKRRNCRRTSIRWQRADSACSALPVQRCPRPPFPRSSMRFPSHFWVSWGGLPIRSGKRSRKRSGSVTWPGGSA